MSRPSFLYSNLTNLSNLNPLYETRLFKEQNVSQQKL